MSDLSTALHEWADRTSAGAPPVADLIAAGQKRRNRRRTLVAGAATLAFAAVAVGVTLGGGGATKPSTPTAAGTEQSPAFELAAAATSTEGTSYRFGIKSTLTLPAWQIDHVTSICSGAVDPVAQTGYVKTNSVFSVRVVDGHRYVAKDTHWFDRGQGGVTGVLLCGDSKAPAGVAADPTTELKYLQKAGTVTKTANGYAFAGPEIQGTAKVSGGKISELSYTVTHQKTKDYPAYVRQVIMQLSGYGEKVSVSKPM
ncbi:hypothetical protein [Actinoplanes subtropicus]|uniref:hypothetical protein n=1 Tax=Actinoplanes subtropicus TaxID=543632 RepID=UPI0004C35CC9|nr:hypothetical protein [Actinoplanes subtropicus]